MSKHDAASRSRVDHREPRHGGESIYLEGAHGLLLFEGAHGLLLFLFIFLSIFFDGAQGLLGAQGLPAAWAMPVADRLDSACGMGATTAAARASAGRA
ncbi:MAG: hypothetical protein AB7S67_07910 [Thiomonas sp.]